MSFDTSSSSTTTTSPMYRHMLLACLTLSLVAFTLGIKPGSLTGLRVMNLIGWAVGAIAAPIVTLAFRTQERDKSNSDDSIHIPNLEIRRQMTILLGFMVVLSIFHAALWSLQRSF